jgi:hypothetical protein
LFLIVLVSLVGVIALIPYLILQLKGHRTVREIQFKDGKMSGDEDRIMFIKAKVGGFSK